MSKFKKGDRVYKLVYKLEKGLRQTHVRAYKIEQVLPKKFYQRQRYLAYRVLDGRIDVSSSPEVVLEWQLVKRDRKL